MVLNGPGSIVIRVNNYKNTVLADLQACYSNSLKTCLPYPMYYSTTHSTHPGQFRGKDCSENVQILVAAHQFYLLLLRHGTSRG